MSARRRLPLGRTGRNLSMVRRLLAVSFVVALSAMAAQAADPPAGIAGLFVTTKYPALTVRAGETTTIDVSVRNFKLPPQSLILTVPQAADGWKATILGGGQPVGAVEVAPDSDERLQLRLEPPAGIGHGDYQFTLEAKNAQFDDKLSITVTIGEEVPAKLKLTTNFPALRGTATTSFKYKVTVNNDSGRDATVNLSGDAPKNFQIGFTEAASADLPASLTIVGQPRIALSGEGGRLSGEAYAGQNSQLTVVLRNDGSEVARDVELNATTPEGWKSDFDPKQVAQLGPGATQDVKVTLTPSERAIAGDYQTTIRASAAGGLSESANFRITVLTSTLWGAVAIAIIAIALLVVVFAVARFGRR